MNTVLPHTFDAYDPKSSRILVVDDEPANLKLLSLMLRTEGYHHVELVQDPREVLPRYQAARPDLILLDINTPPLGRLRRDGANQGLE